MSLYKGKITTRTHVGLKLPKRSDIFGSLRCSIQKEREREFASLECIEVFQRLTTQSAAISSGSPAVRGTGTSGASSAGELAAVGMGRCISAGMRRPCVAIMVEREGNMPKAGACCCGGGGRSGGQGIAAAGPSPGKGANAFGKGPQSMPGWKGPGLGGGKECCIAGGSPVCQGAFAIEVCGSPGEILSPGRVGLGTGAPGWPTKLAGPPKGCELGAI